jgi:diguanylate cyclase (GGDEF)-like protein/PAS domain S-box-containing protein
MRTMYSNLLSTNNFKNEKLNFPPMETILDSLTSGFFIINKDWSITYLNKSMEYWVGKRRSELIGNNIWQALPDAVNSNFYFFYHKVMKEKLTITFEDYYERTKEWLRVSVEPYNDGIIGFVTNITENKVFESTIKDLAYYDHVTDLPNRRLFEEKIEKFIESAKQNKINFSLIYIVLDQFDESGLFNYGNRDNIIISFSSRLLLHLDGRGLISRLGGGEFAILSYGNKESIEELVKSIKKSLEEKPFRVNDEEYYLSASQGISMFPFHGRDTKSLIISAQTALSESKLIEKNTYKFFNPQKREPIE